MGRTGDLAYKAFTAGLGVATVYLTFTFGVNVYRGLSWHSAQTVGVFVLPCGLHHLAAGGWGSFYGWFNRPLDEFLTARRWMTLAHHWVNAPGAEANRVASEAYV